RARSSSSMSMMNANIIPAAMETAAPATLTLVDHCNAISPVTETPASSTFRTIWAGPIGVEDAPKQRQVVLSPRMTALVRATAKAALRASPRMRPAAVSATESATTANSQVRTSTPTWVRRRDQRAGRSAPVDRMKSANLAGESFDKAANPYTAAMRLWQVRATYVMRQPSELRKPARNGRPRLPLTAAGV